MISVSSSDARSEIRLGFVNIEEEMEDSDFEEESTHSYVSCVDPDVALSYIDEKLENVLGHFQKDFEGGVSAENLGAKFGGYGSFLSMYQISPVCSRPKSPPEVQNHVTKTIMKSSFEGGRSASSLAPEVSISGSTSRPPASDVLVELKKSTKSSNTGTPDSKPQSVTKTPSSAPSFQKTLKLRIKVPSDLSSLKKVSTYSREGLTVPPSTSQGNCLKEIEEGLLYGSHDSPTKILMAMMSFPFHKDQLLSPLSDELLHLGERKEIMKDAGYVSVKSDSKNTHVALGISAAQKCGGKFSTGKNEKLKAKAKRMPQSNRLDGNHIGSNAELKADRLSCEELISKTLRLPLLSCPSMKHDTRVDKVSDSYVEDVEGTTKKMNSIGVAAALVGSKPESRENVVALPNQSVTKTENVTSVKNKRKDLGLTERDTLSSLKDIKGSTDKSAEFFDSSGELKEENQSSLLLKAEKEKLSQEKVLKEILNSKETDDDALLSEPDSKHLNKLTDSNEDGHNIKQNVKWEGKNKHSVEGEIEGMKTKRKPDRELSGTFKKPKTGKSQLSASDQPRSNKMLDVVASDKNMIIQASDKKQPDIAKGSLHNGSDDRKRKLKETKESGDCLQLSGAALMESSGDKVRRKKRLKGSSCDEKELPFNSDSCDGDRGVSPENDRDRASHRPSKASSPSLCKYSASEIPKTNVSKAKCSLVESVATSALRVADQVKLKSGRRNLSEKDEHDSNSTAGDTVKRCVDGEDYSTTDKLGTNKKGAAFPQNNNSPCSSDDKMTWQVMSKWGRERAYSENRSMDKLLPKKSGEYSGENCTDGESPPKNREEGSSAPSKEKSRDLDFTSELQDLGTAGEVKIKESRSKKRPPKKVCIESSKEDSREVQDLKAKLNVNGDNISSKWKPETPKSSSGKNNQLEAIEKLKNKSAAPSGRDQIEVLGHGSNTGKQIKRNGKISVTHDIGSPNQKQNGNGHKDHVGLSPLKRESTSQAASNSIKEATDLKHMADRLSNGGENSESTCVYFQAALKFLHGASLLESSGTLHATHRISRSMHIYGSTAELCGFCAREYEKSKDMGAAALAYKCMEVAYLRITYSSHGNISRYRHELQAALQVLPSGESPSFTSDAENSNHILATEKVALSNTGNHVISSGNNSSLSQLLTFSQNVSFAMEASRKAQIAFTAAKGKAFDTQYSDDGITSIKKALDFNFQDMENLLHLVRLAMESINR